MAVKLYGAHWRRLVGIVALVAAPIALLELLVRLAVVPSGAYVRDGTLYTSTGNAAGTGGGITALFVVQILGVLATLVATGAMFRAIAQAYLGHEVDPAASLRLGLSRLGPLVLLSILTGIGLVIAFLLLVLPGIWLGVAWSVAVPVLMVEGVGGPAALQRSFDLVRGRWWATFGALVLLVLLVVFAGGIVGFAIGLLTKGSGSVFVWLLVSVGTGLLVTLFVTPFQAAVLAVIYFDLRVRKEGLDLERLTAGLGLHERRGTTTVGGLPGWEPPSPGR